MASPAFSRVVLAGLTRRNSHLRMILKWWKRQKLSGGVRRTKSLFRAAKSELGISLRFNREKDVHNKFQVLVSHL